jgi:hypothetical protein
MDRAVGAWSRDIVICTAGMDAALRNAEAAFLALHGRLRQFGKAAIVAAIVNRAVRDGEHVHVACRAGVSCPGGQCANGAGR